MVLLQAEADVKAKEEAFHIYHDELVAAEEAADGLARAEKEQALAAEEADARVQELIAQLRASEECVDTAQALKVRHFVWDDRLAWVTYFLDPAAEPLGNRLSRVCFMFLAAKD